MAVDRTRYRQLEYIGADILQARELIWDERMAQGVSVTDNETQVSFPGAVADMRPGAIRNITVGISGLNVTLSATNGALPMQIFVRDRWENFPGQNDDTTGTGGTAPGNNTITLGASDTNVFLNWELRIRTGGLSGDDPTLTDSITNEATASAGELILHLSNVDTSATPLAGNQLAKNTQPISLINFTNSGTLLTLVPQDNVLSSALANIQTSGLVKTTTNTSTVVSTDDPRMTDGRVASDGSVHDASVRVPVAAGGTNSNGTPTYNLTGDIGGISAAKIILIATTQTLEAGWNWLVGSFNSLLTSFNAHATAALGLANTHPVPTAAQVGAAPISHVGLALGLATSHPAVTNVASGGFRVNRGVAGAGAAGDEAYGIFDSLNTNLASLNHSGDVYASLAQALTVTGVSAPATTTGALGLLSTIAKVLSQHVNQNSSSGSFNPHNTSIASLNGAISLAVGSSVTSGLNGGSGQYITLTFHNGGVGSFSVAIGMGTGLSAANGAPGTGTPFTIPLPAGFTSSSALCSAAIQSLTNSNGTRTFMHNVSLTKHSTLSYSAAAEVVDNNPTIYTDCSAVVQWMVVCWS